MSPLVILIMVALVGVQGFAAPQTEPEPVHSKGTVELLRQTDPEPAHSKGTGELLRGLILSTGTKTGKMLKNWVHATEAEEILKSLGFSKGTGELLRGLILSKGTKTGKMLTKLVHATETEEMLKSLGISTEIREMLKNWWMCTGRSTEELFRGLVLSTGSGDPETDVEECIDCKKFMRNVKRVVDSPKFAEFVNSKFTNLCDIFGDFEHWCVQAMPIVTSLVLNQVLPNFDSPKKECIALTFCTAPDPAPSTWY